MALQRTHRPRIRSGRSLRSLGSPLNAQPLGGSGSSFQPRLVRHDLDARSPAEVESTPTSKGRA